MRNLRPGLIVLWIMTAGALACGPLAAINPTATPVPTSTPTATTAPSATLVPSATATATATSTPAPTDTPAPTASATATAAPLALKIISDLPMAGPDFGTTRVIANAEQLRLEQAHNQACGGKVTLSFEAWDDASPATGRWDAAVETGNATKAAADPSIIVYLGTYNSPAAKLAIPILNQKGPLVMISPGNSYPELTKPGQGAPDEPDKFYPSGIRNYARVVSASDVQGTLGARFAKQVVQAQTVYVLDDQEPYGQQVAKAFAAEAARLGLVVVGQASFDPTKGSYTTLMSQIARSNQGRPPDLIYAGTFVQPKTADLLKAKVAVLGNNTKVKFMGPDGIEDQSLVDDAGAIADGIYATISGLSKSHLPAAGQQVFADYATRFGPTTNPYVVYGYEAMSAALKAIEDVCAAGGDPSNRRAVRDAVFNIKDFDGALGKWSFDANGDISLTDMMLYQVSNGQYQTVAISQADQITTIQ